MPEDLDKLIVYVLSLLHGIVSAYLFYLLTGLEISEAYFIIFVIFCACLNILLMRIFRIATIVLAVAYLKCREASLGGSEKLALSARILQAHGDGKAVLSFFSESLLAPPTALYFIGYTTIAFLSAYWLAVGYQNDWVLRSYAQVTDWPKDRDRDPLRQFILGSCSGDPRRVCGDSEFEYLKIWWNDKPFITAGFISSSPTKSQRQVVQLSNTCNIFVGEEGEIKVKKATGEAMTSFIDLDNDKILFIEVDRGRDPCR